jgi:hypothetical protein
VSHLAIWRPFRERLVIEEIFPVQNEKVEGCIVRMELPMFGLMASAFGISKCDRKYLIKFKLAFLSTRWT